MKNIKVIGAGFSGLVMAYYLEKEGFKVTVIEKSNRVGGLLGTRETAFGLVEAAANGLIWSPRVSQIFQDLQISPVFMKKESKNRYIFRDRPRRWPLSLSETGGVLWKLVSTMVGLKSKMAPRPMETIQEWGERTLGLAMTQYLLSPGLQGIYAGDPRELSASLILGRFFSRDQKKKTPYKGTLSAPKGMGELTDSLYEYLKGKDVKFIFDKNYQLTEERPVVLATSASAAAQILDDHSLGEALPLIDVLPIISITAFFKPSSKDLPGFGCLFPRETPVRALGVLFNDSIFEGRSEYRSETWIYGGALDRDCLGLTDEELRGQVVLDRTCLVEKVEQPLEIHIQRWPEAIPHYDTVLEEVLNIADTKNDGIYLIGNYTGALGLSRILEKAWELTQQIKT